MMPWTDVILVLQWWGTLFLVGAAAYPLTKNLFGESFGRGFMLTKAVGMAILTFLVYLLGVTHIAPFTKATIWLVLLLMGIVGVILYAKKRENHTLRRAVALFFEELFFFAALLFWTWVKAHEPSIHNLEKFMDFGFTQSILHSAYFPAPDMWYAGSSINYYYFGHTVMAVLTKLSGIDLFYTFTLMLATIFALSVTMSFAIGREVTKRVWGGVLTAFLVSLAGNMQTIYAFTRGYSGDNVQPFWQLLWGARELWAKLGEGMNTYWYANATRFIPYTIHEFPSYSFVVSDLHGHVLSIPFVLLAIALLLHMFGNNKRSVSAIHIGFYGFLTGVLLMTNALDGPIYGGLFVVCFLVFRASEWKRLWLVVVAALLASLPFLQHFQSFVHGVAVNCPPEVLANTQLGPVLFEGVEKCQRSPLWMWWLLWGFFVYCGIWFVQSVKKRSTLPERVLTIFFFFSLALLLFPEFFYFKDIYPMHFRSNTMFKLGYQAFIMLSIMSAYTIVKLGKRRLFLLILIPQLFLVSIYPIFSIRSYFNSLRNYEGIFGMQWLANQYPDDWAGIQWLNKQIDSPTSLKLRGAIMPELPVIIEADGDSYTDADRFSAFTGFPTIIGWSVHEWLWRGSYDIVAPRREEVRRIYESTNVEEARAILTNYHVRYIIVGTLERQKFKSLHEETISQLAIPVFSQGETTIYAVH